MIIFIAAATERSTIQAGMNMIQSGSCIRFVPRSSETSYVNIVRGASGTGCYADVGRQSGRINTVNLQYNGCITSGIAAHELIHAVGYYHEQSRPDRDDHVTINWSNIQSGEYSWQKVIWTTQSSNRFEYSSLFCSQVAPSTLTSTPQPKWAALEFLMTTTASCTTLHMLSPSTQPHQLFTHEIPPYLWAVWDNVAGCPLMMVKRSMLCIPVFANFLTPKCLNWPKE